MSTIRSRESTSTKMKGAGDGLKTIVRTPVPSSRKFTATPNRNQSKEQELKKALDEMNSKQGNLIKKSKSVAEITPTKTKVPRQRRPDAGSALVLHATPRPPADDEVSEPPSRRPNERHYEEWGARAFFRYSFRRTKARLSMTSEILQRRNDLVLKLENQVVCLKNLNQSECDKRNEAINERQRVECILQSLRTANENLHNEKTALQNEITHLQNTLQKNDIDMENVKNDINSKNTYLKRLENEIQKERQLIQKLQEEKISAVDKIKAQDIAIKLQDEANERMSQTVNNLENEIKNAESAKQVLTLEFNKLTERYQQELKEREDAQSELEDLKSVKEEMINKINNLEEKLATMTDNCFTLSTQLQDKLYWWDRFKDFVIISWSVLQNAAYIMLPAL